MALTDSLVSYYKLDESSGNASDSVASNTLTNNNTVTYAPEKINNGAVFAAASSQSLSITDASQTGLDLTGDFSFNFWFNPASQPGTDTAQVLFAKWLTTGNQRSYGFQYRDDGGTKNLGIVTSVDGSATTFNSVNQTLTNGTLYMITVTKTGTSATIYVNASSIGTAGTSATQFNSTAGFYLGSLDGTAQFLNGAEDEVGIWSRVITGTEITELYNGGAGNQYPFASATTTARSTGLNLLGVGQ